MASSPSSLTDAERARAAAAAAEQVRAVVSSRSGLWFAAEAAEERED